jgi:hypothetical protein
VLIQTNKLTKFFAALAATHVAWMTAITCCKGRICAGQLLNSECRESLPRLYPKINLAPWLKLVTLDGHSPKLMDRTDQLEKVEV